MNCVHKFNYGHKKSTSHFVAEVRPLSPAHRRIQARRCCQVAGLRCLGFAGCSRIQRQYQLGFRLAQAVCRFAIAEPSGGLPTVANHGVRTVT